MIKTEKTFYYCNIIKTEKTIPTLHTIMRDKINNSNKDCIISKYLQCVNLIFIIE